MEGYKGMWSISIRVRVGVMDWILDSLYMNLLLSLINIEWKWN